MGKAALVLEDITFSEEWRLGTAEDFNDADVAKRLAEWYFTFHENGAGLPELEGLYFEYDAVTAENLTALMDKFPEAKELLQYILEHYEKFRALLYRPAFTLTYNDFHWTNFVVRQDKQAAMMFDYNLLGRGYRYSDFRNVCWEISDASKEAFTLEYNRRFLEKHGHTRDEAEKLERPIDEAAAPLFSLITAFLERETFPEWGNGAKKEVLDGKYMRKIKQLLVTI
jgi:hypothetical protein